jgi:hypothetical protein
MRKLYFLGLLLVLPLLMNAQTRYLDEVFENVTVETVDYGVNITVLFFDVFGPVPQVLQMDVYMPEGDTEVDRPLALFFHTGNFLPFRNPGNPAELGFNGSCAGERTDSSAVEICTRLAKMGYVAASVSYRLGWNPLAPTEVLRRFGIINAAYRGVQDARTAIRYFRRSQAEQGNPFGIDPNRIVLVGQGTGGYITMNTAILDNWLKIPLASDGKFVWDHDNDPATPPIPMVIEAINGDIYATSFGVAPSGDTLCIPNHVGYSSDFALAVNFGGASADTAWVDPGQPPLISFHVPNDNFAPYGQGIVSVPGTNLQVIEAQGSYLMQLLHEEKGNQDAMVNAGIEFDLTAEQMAAFANSPAEFREPAIGLYPFVVPPNPNAPALPSTTSPWEWTSYVSANPLQNCNNDKEYAMGYIDTIMRFYAPRACFVLELDECIEKITGLDIIPSAEVSLNAYPNPATDLIYLETSPEFLMREIQLYDEMGRLHRVQSGVNAHIFALERQRLPAGRYIALIRFDEGTAVKKLIFN